MTPFLAVLLVLAALLIAYVVLSGVSPTPRQLATWVVLFCIVAVCIYIVVRFVIV